MSENKDVFFKQKNVAFIMDLIVQLRVINNFIEENEEKLLNIYYATGEKDVIGSLENFKCGLMKGYYALVEEFKKLIMKKEESE